MPFRATFDCLWCGRPHTATGPSDLEGYAQLCPDCVGKAQDNGFLRFRVRAALAERSAATAPTPRPAPGGATAPAPAPAAATPRQADAPATMHGAAADVAAPGTDDEMLAYYAARTPEYDDWYLRRGRYSHGAIADMAWQMDLDQATTWLDGLPLRGEIVELAAGTGFWSPLLAQKGELSLYDALERPLERARDRLVAHGLRAHLHVRDAWTPPDRQVDAVFTGFWLSHVPRERLGSFLDICRAWLKPGGRFAFIDSRDDPQSGAVDRAPAPGPDLARRRLADGREFTIPKVFYEPDELMTALRDAGFVDARVTTTHRFFTLGEATT